MKATTMKRNAIRLAAVLLAGIFLAPGLAFSWDKGPGWRDGKGYCKGRGFGMGMEGRRGGILGVWDNPETAKELGLTDEQVDKLKEADFASREKVLGLRAKKESYKLELDKAFSASTVDETKVREIAGQMNGVRGEMFMERLESWLTAKKILTPEQIDKLEEERMERRKHRRGFDGDDDDQRGRRGKMDAQ